MINLDPNVTVAKIAKVRDKLTDGSVEFDDVDEAEQVISEAATHLKETDYEKAAAMDDDDRDDDEGKSEEELIRDSISEEEE